MERLTKKSEIFGDITFSGDGCTLDQVKQRLFDYEDAEEQGLLIRLPCKIGDVLYCTGKGWIKELIVKEMMIRKDFVNIFTEDIEGEKYAFSSGMIGKSIFLTREEAEAALAEMEG